MATPVDAKQRAMSTYNAAADFYDHPVNTFWEWYGQQTVSRLRLEAGAKILDVCCGSGASAIPAAKAVGPNGFVLGVDLAENLIELAKAKARERGLENIEFRIADMSAGGSSLACGSYSWPPSITVRFAPLRRPRRPIGCPLIYLRIASKNGVCRALAIFRPPGGRGSKGHEHFLAPPRGAMNDPTLIEAIQ